MGRKESRQDRADQDSWNNVPTRAAKIQVGPLTPRRKCVWRRCANDSSCHEKPDVSKLPKLPASSALDPSSMSFGPPRLGPGGGLGTWGRGSGNKKLSVQETAPLKQVNR